MPTKLFQQLPWIGGLNTSLDESMIPPNQLTVCDHVVFDTRGSRKKRDGIKHNWDNVSSGSVPMVGLHDFWFGTSSKTQRIVSVGNNRTFRSYTTTGTATSITDAGTAWSGTLTNVSMTTFNNLLIIAASGSGNVLKKWTGSGDIADLDGTPPVASIVREHLGRLWTNDKTNLDRVHFSPVHDHTLWNGNGDSGAVDIGIGDGDPDGIQAIFPSFKGNLFVAKRTKLYRINTATNNPADWTIDLVSSGIGCVSHNSITTIDQDDIFFVSERGIHSLSATQSYGDFESTYVSTDIQKSFRDTLSQTRLKQIWSAYDPSTNTVAYAVTESSVRGEDLTFSKLTYGASNGVTSSVNNTLYLYHIPSKCWYRWGGISCQSLIAVRDGSDAKIRFFLGTHITRISKTKNGTNYDISSSGSNVAIPFKVATGVIYPNGNSYLLNGLKRFILYYKPVGSHTITASIRLDNLDLNTENTLTFTQSGSSALLGSTFTLGTSLLGYTLIMGPYARTIEGVCRGFKITLQQSGTDEEVEIQGFAVEYEELNAYADNDTA